MCAGGCGAGLLGNPSEIQLCDLLTCLENTAEQAQGCPCWTPEEGREPAQPTPCPGSYPSRGGGGGHLLAGAQEEVQPRAGLQQLEEAGDRVTG